MSNRISVINKYILDTDKVVDVGCDHALLGIMLSKRNMKSIASDINEQIIEKRKKEINNELITFMVSDGLKDIDDSLYDTVVISGMGSATIEKIVSSSTKKFKKLVTVSNKDYYYLRKSLTKLGYKITLEEVIYDKGKFYNLIIFEEGKCGYSYKEYLLGVNHQNLETYKEKCKSMYKKYEHILLDIPKNKKEQIKVIKQMMKVLESEI